MRISIYTTFGIYNNHKRSVRMFSIIRAGGIISICIKLISINAFHGVHRINCNTLLRVRQQIQIIINNNRNECIRKIHGIKLHGKRVYKRKINCRSPMKKKNNKTLQVVENIGLINFYSQYCSQLDRE